MAYACNFSYSGDRQEDLSLRLAQENVGKDHLKKKKKT
jgi:hypothetical protein